MGADGVAVAGLGLAGRRILFEDVFQVGHQHHKLRVADGLVAAVNCMFRHTKQEPRLLPLIGFPALAVDVVAAEALEYDQFAHQLDDLQRQEPKFVGPRLPPRASAALVALFPHVLLHELFDVLHVLVADCVVALRKKLIDQIWLLLQRYVPTALIGQFNLPLLLIGSARLIRTEGPSHTLVHTLGQTILEFVLRHPPSY